MEWYWYVIIFWVLGFLWLGKELHDAPLMPDNYDEDQEDMRGIK